MSKLFERTKQINLLIQFITQWSLFEEVEKSSRSKIIYDMLF